MSDEVACLLRSAEPLVVVEAPAGCGKTHQGAEYAKDVVTSLAAGRLLILAHTHAACGVFRDRTRGAGSKVEIKTIASLTVEMGSAYHKALSLPANPEAWAWKNGGVGFEEIAQKCAALLREHPMIARALGRRYPIIICDEHQDCTAEQHAVLMALHKGGAMLRIFSDPLQRIFTGRTAKEAKQDAERWNELRKSAACAELDFPHRWKNGSVELGAWILKARTALLSGQPIEFPNPLPAGLNVIVADNEAPPARAVALYLLGKDARKPVDKVMFSGTQMMVLAINNMRVRSLSALMNRSIGVWEGQSREDLSRFVEALTANKDNAEAIGRAVVTFVSSVAAGFSLSSHGERLIEEIADGCSKPTIGKPAAIQAMGKLIVDEPNHIGAARALKLLASYVGEKKPGFTDVKVDYKVEFAEAIRLEAYATPEDGFAELARRRIHFRRSLPLRVLSTVHKAKGLECANAIVIPCDGGFSGTYYSKCRLYVALSRASHTLTLVVPSKGGSPLLRN